MASRCSLAILFSDPRKLRLRHLRRFQRLRPEASSESDDSSESEDLRAEWPLSLGYFDPRSLVAVQLGIEGQFLYPNSEQITNLSRFEPKNHNLLLIEIACFKNKCSFITTPS